ncbi:chemotaxis protein [Rhodobacteraceae bacterium RKSG542]|uniref:rod-binding protein n=1 Tax=Pseudovibrio flavus TaxID=2529854 RepID=UPI0012BCEDB7|nr:rod-binding protein [Pseudovibrio flavus]MTI19266.1 chemotaxis protein [Pseudovibrio flavus]
MSLSAQLSANLLALQDTPAQKASQTLNPELQKKAEEFEAVFLNQMLQSMFSGLGEDSLYGGGAGSEAWRSLQVNEYAASLSENGGIGLADAMKQQLLQLQEI